MVVREKDVSKRREKSEKLVVEGLKESQLWLELRVAFRSKVGGSLGDQCQK
jgi:hypothetical protein